VEKGTSTLDTSNSDIGSYLTKELLLAADTNMPANVRQRVMNDLLANLKLSSFVPHPPIQDSEITGRQDMIFNINTSKTSVTFEVNGEPYKPSRIDRICRWVE
jgi:hypothetical protein